jgi:hypothetical protein
MVGDALSADVMVERIALRVVELLRGEAPLLDAAAVGRRLGRSRDWVYRHADELGAVRLGDGERPRLGFDPARVAAYGASGSSAGRRTQDGGNDPVEPKRRRRRVSPNAQRDELLPIRGEAP